MVNKHNTIVKCNDCGREINLEYDELVTECKSSIFGYYYKGEGICRACSEKRYEIAKEEYQAISD